MHAVRITNAMHRETSQRSLGFVDDCKQIRCIGGHCILFPRSFSSYATLLSASPSGTAAPRPAHRCITSAYVVVVA